MRELNWRDALAENDRRGLMTVEMVLESGVDVPMVKPYLERVYGRAPLVDEALRHLREGIEPAGNLTRNFVGYVRPNQVETGGQQLLAFRGVEQLARFAARISRADIDQHAQRCERAGVCALRLERFEALRLLELLRDMFDELFVVEPRLLGDQRRPDGALHTFDQLQVFQRESLSE
jgi:hypothetical protein